jgi:hypothetical protein
VQLVHRAARPGRAAEGLLGSRLRDGHLPRHRLLRRPRPVAVARVLRRQAAAGSVRRFRVCRS